MAYRIPSGASRTEDTQPRRRPNAGSGGSGSSHCWRAGEAGLYTETFEHVRAVFATLAEAVGPDEWYDVTVELPPDYHGLIPARSA